MDVKQCDEKKCGKIIVYDKEVGATTLKVKTPTREVVITPVDPTKDYCSKCYFRQIAEAGMLVWEQAKRTRKVPPPAKKKEAKSGDPAD